MLTISGWLDCSYLPRPDTFMRSLSWEKTDLPNENRINAALTRRLIAFYPIAISNPRYVRPFPSHSEYQTWWTKILLPFANLPRLINPSLSNRKKHILWTSLSWTFSVRLFLCVRGLLRFLSRISYSSFVDGKLLLATCSRSFHFHFPFLVHHFLGFNLNILHLSDSIFAGNSFSIFIVIVWVLSLCLSFTPQLSLSIRSHLAWHLDHPVVIASRTTWVRDSWPRRRTTIFCVY